MIEVIEMKVIRNIRVVNLMMLRFNRTIIMLLVRVVGGARY